MAKIYTITTKPNDNVAKIERNGRFLEFNKASDISVNHLIKELDIITKITPRPINQKTDT